MFYAIDNIGGYKDEQGLCFSDPMVGGSFIQIFFSVVYDQFIMIDVSVMLLYVALMEYDSQFPYHSVASRSQICFILFLVEAILGQMRNTIFPWGRWFGYVRCLRRNSRQGSHPGDCGC